MGRGFAGFIFVLATTTGCTGALEEPGRAQSQVTLEGRVQLEIAEGPGFEETRVWLLDQASGLGFRLHFDGASVPAWHPGDSYRVTGLREGQEVLVDAYEPTAIAPTEEVAAVQHALHDHPRGDRRVIAILADTAHLADETRPAYPFTEDIVQRVDDYMWTGERSVDGLYRTATEGSTSFVRDTNGDGSPDIYGPYVVPDGLSNPERTEFLNAAAASDGADFSLYQHRLYVYSRREGGTGLLGAANLGCDYQLRAPDGSYIRDSCKAEIYVWDMPRVYAHELGHNLNLNHSDTSGDDVMESHDSSERKGGLNLFNAPHADKLGSYAPFPEAMVTLTESGTYTLQALGTDPSTATYPFMLKLARPNTDDNYYISFRNPVGYDVDLPTYFSYSIDGAFVHIFPKDKFTCYTEDNIRYCPKPKLVGRSTLADGATWDLGEQYNDWQDPDDGQPNGVLVSQLSHTADTVTVSVTIPVCGNGVCDANEACDTCAADCGECGACGDGTCNTAEDCASCAADCGACPYCGDGSCGAEESCASCEADCGSCATCGDGACNGDESCSTCSSDCGDCPTCGDGTCNGAETCDSCSSDCGACACLAKDAWCSSDAECCSGKCRGRSGAQRCKG